jgi:hypothetical protein
MLQLPTQNMVSEQLYHLINFVIKRTSTYKDEAMKEKDSTAEFLYSVTANLTDSVALSPQANYTD